MNLFGRSWTRREIEARVGRMEQLAGLRPVRLTGGPGDGVEAVEVRTGGGLDYTVLPSRGMDISLCQFGGAAISWQSPNGDVHPAHYDPRGAHWLRSACGGLLMTCGLTNVGSPCTVDGEELGAHGRAHALPARLTAAETLWRGDECDLRVAGVAEQTRLFGDNIRLTREIRSRVGRNVIAITDVVENLAFGPTPLMLLYHFNFGFPLLAEGVTIELPPGRVVPRDAGVSPDAHDRWERPQGGIGERVYYHEDLQADPAGRVSAVIRNPAFPTVAGATALAVRLTWKPEQLPCLAEWKMTGESMHVLGIEPGNCHVQGQEAERARGTLQTLAPGETKTFEVELAVEVGR